MAKGCTRGRFTVEGGCAGDGSGGTPREAVGVGAAQVGGAGTPAAGGTAGTITFAVEVAHTVAAEHAGQRRNEAVGRAPRVEQIAERPPVPLGEVAKIDVLLVELVHSLLQEPFPHRRHFELSSKLHRCHGVLGILDQELPDLLLLLLELVVQGLVLLDDVGICRLRGGEKIRQVRKSFIVSTERIPPIYVNGDKILL